MESFQTLPPPSHLSPFALSFLDHKFHTKLTLAEAPSFVAELQTQCSDLDRILSGLNRRRGSGLAGYASFSGKIHSFFGDVDVRLNNLSSTCSSTVVPDGKGGKGFREELAALAKEVAKFETVRVYVGF
ncbi:unnamed protein product [Lupinus luteus]|uniref:Uncharacterized protein n=1 Tax=Lupinus luteus TaxID=3873 RepID=A0AAV1Y7G1_LUPLU